MRKISFKVRNIGSEKYLSYVLNDDLDFDEELLDYLEDNNIPELIDIIYEEDDEHDYLTYNVTDRTTVETLIKDEVTAEKMLCLVRGVAAGIVNMRDLGIPVSYVVLDKRFTYVNPVTYDVKMICVPADAEGGINAEFKLFIKSIITNATYSDKEDCNYVAKIINMLNVEKFTIRGFLGQITELMEAAGISVEDTFMDIGDSDVSVSQSAETVGSEMDMNDLPDVGDVSFDDEDDDLDMYQEEAPEANTIFKDLDLDAEEKTSVDMSAFDDSALQELEIEDIPDIPEEEEEEESAEPVAEEIPEEAAADEIPDIEEIIKDIQPSMTEVKPIEEEVTEVKPTSKGEIKLNLIDTDNLDDIIDTPPVVKNIRINRAKIIQTATVEADDDIVDDPTENIIAEVDENGESIEPATNLEPVKIEEEVEVVPDEEVKEPEVTKPAAPAIKAMPYIIRVNTGERVMINKAVFKIGKASRGVDFSIGGNGAISRVHAIVYQREDGCYLKDNKATNATYINGEKLGENQEMILKNDAILIFGGEEFIFKLN